MSERNYSGAAYNAMMEEETKESLVLMVLDGFDELRAIKVELEMWKARAHEYRNWD